MIRAELLHQIISFKNNDYTSQRFIFKISKLTKLNESYVTEYRFTYSSIFNEEQALRE